MSMTTYFHLIDNYYFYINPIQSVSLFFCLSVCLSVCSSVVLKGVFLPLFISVCLCLSVFVCVPVCVLSVCLSVSIYVSVFTISQPSGQKQGLIMSCTISFYRKVKVKDTQGHVHSKKLSISNKYVRDLVDQRFHLVRPIFAKKFSQIA